LRFQVLWSNRQGTEATKEILTETFVFFVSWWLAFQAYRYAEAYDGENSACLTRMSSPAA
jgi:hypothetical protein